MSEMKMPSGAPPFVAVAGQDARKDPVRLVVVQGEERPPVVVDDEPLVMTFPHLLLRELVAFLSLSLFLVLLSLFFDAPLEEIANPQKTPNPAKAPWYFLGLQELLHYYPPIVSGVLLPGLVVLSLMVIPYFDINLERRPLWDAAGRARRGRILAALGAVVAALSAVFLFTGSHAVWPVIVPLWLVALLMALPGLFPEERGPALRWLARQSLAFWIFFWFLLSAVTLTTIGTFFRGPGWSFVLPGQAGGAH